LPLNEKVTNGFYFEIGEVAHGVIRIAAFVTPEKPNLMSNPVPNEPARIRALQEMFRKLRELKDYNVVMVDDAPVLLKAQGVVVQVTGIRANISRKDRSEIVVDEVAGIIEKNLVPPLF
jgi:phosphatidylglycerophosphatase A